MTNIDDRNQQMALEDIVEATLDANSSPKEEIEQIISDEVSSKIVAEGFEKTRMGRVTAGGGLAMLGFTFAYLDAFLRDNGYGARGTTYTYDYDLVEAQTKALTENAVPDDIDKHVKLEPSYSHSFVEEIILLWDWLVKSKVWRDYYDEENLRIFEERAMHNRISIPFAGDKLMDAQYSADRLTTSFPQPGQAPQDHIPLEMQVIRDKTMKIYNVANSTEGLAEEPGRARRTRGGSKGPDVTKFRSEPIPNDVPALTSPPAHTPPASSEFPLPFSSQFIPPAERSQSPPPQYRFSGPFTALSPAATAALATPAYTPPSVAGAAASGAPQVIITGITPPPTRLADAEFKRCLQRELNDIVRNFDTGMWV